jgi:alkylation response protein AidB-like acyl-CoA dehydrogenase
MMNTSIGRRMDDSLDGDLASLHQTAQRLADQMLLRNGSFEDGAVRPAVDREGWSAMVEMGWPALSAPIEHGGYGLALRYLAAVAAPFARHGASHPLAITGAEIPALLLGCGAADRAKEVMNSLLRDGQLVVSALWDAGHPYELSCVNTRWRASGGGFVLNGTKSPVPYAVLADAFIVLAVSEEGSEPALFVVGKEALGVSVVPLPTTTSAPTGELQLVDVRLSGDDLLDSTNPIEAVRRAVDAGAAIASAELTVAAARGIELTVEYVKMRKQFNQAIGAFQAVHHHCADMYRDVEAMRILSSASLGFTLDAAMDVHAVSSAKAHASTKGVEVLQMAHQLHGGVAFYVDYPLELLYRRSLVLQGEYGSARWHRKRIAQTLQAAYKTN